MSITVESFKIWIQLNGISIHKELCWKVSPPTNHYLGRFHKKFLNGVWNTKTFWRLSFWCLRLQNWYFYHQFWCFKHQHLFVKLKLITAFLVFRAPCSKHQNWCLGLYEIDPWVQYWLCELLVKINIFNICHIKVSHTQFQTMGKNQPSFPNTFVFGG